jgi:hypothetical protein
MFFARLTFASKLLLGALVVLPTAAVGQTGRRFAQGEPADPARRAALVAERQRVRGELERANAEIDGLKRSGRGMREDYRLRERLADAEALARRLTELDARLGSRPGSAAVGPGAEPQVSSSDGPVELDAKADILADQAQRLSARGDALLGRAHDLRARQTLRRRVGQMERDPFSPLEGSKRRAMTGTVTGNLAAGGTPPTGGSTTAPPTTTTTTTTISSDKPAPGTGQLPLSPGPSQAGAGTGPARGDSSPGVLNTAPAANMPSTGGSSASVGASPTGAPTPTSVTDTASLSVQLRDLLDPATLAQIQHLEAAGGAPTSFEALERAGAALKARADRLRQQAAALRASEHAR